MKKIIDYTLVVIALVIAVIFYFSFDLEGILWDKYEKERISSSDIKNDRSRDYTGLNAGEDILSIKTIGEWDDVLNEVDYVTAKPKSIIKTDVYSLAKWASYYTTKRNGSSGRKLEEVIKTSLDISPNYSPYYIIELEDGNHILAQMNRGIAKKIQNGEEVSLPLGKKIGFLQKAKTLLKPICEEYDVNTKYVLYTINNNWESENENKIFIEKFVISFVIFIVLAVVLQLVINKIFFRDDEE